MTVPLQLLSAYCVFKIVTWELPFSGKSTIVCCEHKYSHSMTHDLNMVYA